jgi:arsenite methyltransferase
MSKDLMYRDEVQDLVRDAYMAVDKPASPAGRFYGSEQLATIPEEAREWAMGVGNPLRHAALSEGETVVDLGCGAGIDVFLAANQVGAGGSVIGVDFLDSMVQRGRRIAADSGFENVDFIRAEIDDLPLDDGETDVVVSNGSINLAARKSRVFAEAKRILRPGGRLCVADLTIKEEELPSEILVHPSAWAG